MTAVVGQDAVTRSSGARRAWEILAAFTRAEIRETHEFSFSGVVKWMLEPLSYMLVYFVLIGTILGKAQPAYLLFLLCALVPWRYFSGVVSRAMTLIGAYREPLTNRDFPRFVLPFVAMAAEGMTMLIALVLFAPLMATYQIPPTPALLWLPVLVVILAVLTSGPAYLMTLFGLYLADYRGAAQNALRLGFLASTALVPLRAIPGDRLPELLEANPFSSVFESFRAIVIHGRAPRAFDLMYPLLVGLVLLALGAALYGRRQNEFAKEV